MSLYFVANTTEQLHFSDTLPDYLKPLVINGASCQACAGKFGHILLQQIDTPAFCLRQIHFHFNQPTHIGITQEEPQVEIYINLGKQVQFHVHQVGNIALDTGAYNIFYSPFIKNEYFFQQALEYKTLSISCAPQLLASLAQAFPVMDKLVEKTRQQKPFMLFGGDTMVSREVMYTIREITNCSYTGELLNVFLEARIVDVLLLCLKNERRNGGQLHTDPGDKKKYKMHVVAAVQRIKEFIDQNPSNDYGTASLAATSGISRSILHQAFKHEFGIEIGEYKLKVRMHLAQKMLIDGCPIKEVAIHLHYASTSAFTSAFKNFFGYPPSDFQEQIKK